MRRLIIAVVVLFAPVLFGAVTVQHGDRIAMLRPAEREVDTWLLHRVRVNVMNELRSLGVDAFDALDLVRTYEVHENVSTGPAFGAGPRFFFLLPFPRYVSSREAARAAAREAALKIANVNQIE